MYKKFILLLISLFLIGLALTPNLISAETAIRSHDLSIHDAHIRLNDRMIFLKSMSTQYVPHLYPDTFYIGPNYVQHNYPDNMNSEKEADIIIIDLKWELTKDWSWGLYTEIGPKNEGHENKGDLYFDNPKNTDFGIVFIHEF